MQCAEQAGEGDACVRGDADGSVEVKRVKVHEELFKTSHSPVTNHISPGIAFTHAFSLYN